MSRLAKCFLVVLLIFWTISPIAGKLSEHLNFVLPSQRNTTLQVNVTGGTIQGAESVTYHKNVTFFKYLGIPYAEPPIDDLRWKSPQPALPWPDVLNATRERPFCVQMSTDEGIEDCLYMNVYVPQIKNLTNYAVMVWIYGGRFANGNGNYSLYGPDFLLERQVAFVSFNYRLGIFGFLSSEDMTLPGNYGLKDQVHALRWIRENIAKFGGDPQRVTIFGDSSGAACVSYLLLIPQAKGLFQRAIMQSGSALCPWAYQREPRKILTMLGYACRIFDSNITQVVARLRKEDTKKLRTKVLAINVGNAMEPLNGLPFAPSVEPLHDDAVLTKHSNELFVNGKFNTVPFMIGFTAQEASIVQDVIERTRPYIAHWDILPQLLVPANLNVSSKMKRKEIAMKIKTYYFGRKLIAMSSKTEMMNFIGDSQFVRSIRHNVQVCANHSTIYLYVFSYEGYIGRYGTKKEVTRKVKGAGHVEDVFYLFLKSNMTTNNDSDWRIISVMTELWTNFAKNGCAFIILTLIVAHSADARDLCKTHFIGM